MDKSSASGESITKTQIGGKKKCPERKGDRHEEGDGTTEPNLRNRQTAKAATSFRFPLKARQDAQKSTLRETKSEKADRLLNTYTSLWEREDA